MVTDKISDNIILSFDNTSGRKNKESGRRLKKSGIITFFFADVDRKQEKNE